MSVNDHGQFNTTRHRPQRGERMNAREALLDDLPPSVNGWTLFERGDDVPPMECADCGSPMSDHDRLARCPEPRPVFAIHALRHLPAMVNEKRRRRGLPLRQAAKEIGIGFNSLARFEHGHEVSLSNAVALLKWVGKSDPTPDPQERRRHRNGCAGCDHEPLAYPPCWTDEQVSEEYQRTAGRRPVTEIREESA